MSLFRNVLFQWRIVVLFGVALFVRLVLSPFPGFYGDVNVLVQYSRVLAQKGLSSADELTMTELYPAGYMYHAYVVGNVLKNRLRNADDFLTEGMKSDGASIAERIGARAFPIVYDLMIGAVLLIVLGRYVSRQAGEWSAAIYLFNPGVIVNSAMWNYDSMASFFLLVAVVFLALAIRDSKDIFWMVAWSAAGLALCMKLQAGMLVPVLGLITLFTRRLKLVVMGPLALFATVAVVFSPFLLGRQWPYLKRVFIDSFHSYPVTHAGAYNLWGIWFQRPVSDRFAGITFESIGRGLFLAAILWLSWWVWRKKVVNGGDALRRIAIVMVYSFSAPFVLLTRMHERYLAPAVAVAILAGLLDPRMRGVMWGISSAYAVNLLAVLTQGCWRLETGEMAEAIHISYCVNRFFCCALILGVFAWLTWRLPRLLENNESKSNPANASFPAVASAVNQAV